MTAAPPSAIPVLLRACWLLVRGPGDWGSLVEFARLIPVVLVVAVAADAGFAIELLLGGAATVSFDGSRVWVGTSLRATVLGGRIMDVGRGFGGGGIAALSSDCLPLSLPLFEVSSLIDASLPSLEILRMND